MEDEDLTSSATWQEPIMEKEMQEMGETAAKKPAKLTSQQLVLSTFIEKAAKCISEQQLMRLRAPFVGDDSKCGVCGVAFWTAGVGITLPYQRHHCYACGRALCNACCLQIQMENGHRGVDGRYVRDFTWQAKFCMDHELVTGETRAAGSSDNSATNTNAVNNNNNNNNNNGNGGEGGALAWLGFLVSLGSLVVSVFPVVSSLRTAVTVGRPLLWSYRMIRLFV